MTGVFDLSNILQFIINYFYLLLSGKTQNSTKP